MSTYRCPGRRFGYEEVRDVPQEGFPAHSPRDGLPKNWRYPDCAVRDEIDFEVMGMNR